MISNVPQFIDVEDKIAGPLTGKQLLWMIGMGAMILVARLIFGGGPGLYVAVVPIVIVFSLFAFYKPNGQPLILFVIYGFFFLFRPKIMMWRRSANTPVRKMVPNRTGASGAVKAEHHITAEEIHRVAQLVDKR
ncbi:MAG: PrgI family protein [Candidatus Moranbacteria bacterium]|nr:PrgI family protein [Candidatus Moranbacteria bacterium]